MTAHPTPSAGKVIEKPMLFSDSMVRAILDGRKTVTRRIIKLDDPEEWPSLATSTFDADDEIVFQDEDGVFKHSVGKCPHPIGSRIWVKERYGYDNKEYVDTYKAEPWRGMPSASTAEVHYLATELKPDIFPKGYWKSSMFMPRWASRITLEVTDVRVERLQDIESKPRDAWNEGVRCSCTAPVPQCAGNVAAFRELWQSINGPDSWAANPWVWVYTFKQLSTEATG